MAHKQLLHALPTRAANTSFTRYLDAIGVPADDVLHFGMIPQRLDELSVGGLAVPIHVESVKHVAQLCFSQSHVRFPTLRLGN